MCSLMHEVNTLFCHIIQSILEHSISCLDQYPPNSMFWSYLKPKKPSKAHNTSSTPLHWLPSSFILVRLSPSLSSKVVALMALTTYSTQAELFTPPHVSLTSSHKSFSPLNSFSPSPPPSPQPQPPATAWRHCHCW